MRRILLLLFFSSLGYLSFAGRISGLVSDTKANILAYASIIIKGTSKGVVANSQGKYTITLDAGDYTIVCQYVGYKSEERKITVGTADMVVNFVLSVQELTMQEVIIKRGEDPAIEIIKQAIKKRDFYNNQVDSFTVDVYIKGLLRTNSIPDRMLGQKVDKSEMEQQGFDSLGRGILFLSESQTKVSFSKPDKYKYQVISSRQSGGGYGISFPFFINFYTNNVEVFENLNPRGFVSPIADNAFHFYKFPYEGNFFEGGKMIDRIRVTPKRKFEPLFDGYIQIVDDEWRIHSIDLTTTKDYQLDLVDTLHIRQIHAPVNNDIWRTQNQVVYLSANTFGIEWSGNFLNVYNNYNLAPGFTKKYFNRTVMSFDTAFNKKDSLYWNSTRPVPLEMEEKRDFVFRDSLYKKIRDSIYAKRTLDSLNKYHKKIGIGSILLGGVQRTYYGSSGRMTYEVKPLIRDLEYNTAEGVAMNVDQSVKLRPRKGKYDFEWDLLTRYGFSNQHFNAYGSFITKPKTDNFRNQYLALSGGKRVSQFNHDNPITPMMNTVYSLFFKKNYMKIYENWFGNIEYNNRFENGVSWNVNLTYEDRMPLENTTSYSFFKKERIYLPNHPFELASIPFQRQQAAVAEITLTYQPGQRYIKFPEGKFSLGSKYPTLELKYSKGLPMAFGSDVDFDKWKFSIYDDLNLKMGGVLKYRVGVGGFLNNKSVGIPDFQHFNGNQTYYSSKYLNSFQLAPYYRYSNTESFYAVAHLEHHFNGLLTNKLPLLKKLKWNLVAGTNSFYVNTNNYYVEAFAGLENIFKFMRLDFVWAYQAEPGRHLALRLGLGGVLGGLIRERN
ncbi:MAG: DUF5686 and carboxypeptidase regulatory-like domain-containing protein [Flavisolibacter sp.]